MDGRQRLRNLAVVAHAMRDEATRLRPPLIANGSKPKIRDESAPPPVPLHSPKAFVSWAHSGEDWTSQQSSRWSRDVAEFATILWRNGLMAELDLFHSHDSSVDWTRYGPAQVQASDFILVVMSEAWSQRWSGANNPRVGAGAVGEADALKGLFQRNQKAWQQKVLIVLLPGQEPDLIPLDLARLNRFSVDPEDLDSFDGLLRTVTAQPLFAQPDLGVVPILPPSVTKNLRIVRHDSHTEEYSEYLAVQRKLKELAKAAAAGRQSEADTELSSLLLGVLDAMKL